MKRTPISRRRRFDDIIGMADAYAAVRARSAGRCEARRSIACTGQFEHFHHRLMRSQGGQDTADNGLAVCQPCHLLIHANPAESYRYGHLIRGASAPAGARWTADQAMEYLP